MTKEKSISETIYGLCPSKSNSYRIGPKGSFYKSTALRNYESTFYMQCKSRNRMIEGYFELEAQVYYPSMRSDIDGALKVILDCLQKGKVIKNDNRCVKITIGKYVDKAKPRVELTIIEL